MAVPRQGRPGQVDLVDQHDVTEKRRIEVQFMRAQRMESLGILAGGIAHDLNNILTPIMLSIDVLKSMTTEAHQKSILETIELSARRGVGHRAAGPFLRPRDGRPAHRHPAEVPAQGHRAYRQRHLPEGHPPRAHPAARDVVDPWRSDPGAAGAAQPLRQRPRRHAERRHAHDQDGELPRGRALRPR